MVRSLVLITDTGKDHRIVMYFDSTDVQTYSQDSVTYIRIPVASIGNLSKESLERLVARDFHEVVVLTELNPGGFKSYRGRLAEFKVNTLSAYLLFGISLT